jgi:hypothetical protein
MTMTDVDFAPWCDATVSGTQLTLSHVSLSHTPPPLMTGVPAPVPVPVSSLRTTRQPRRHGRATLALRINHTREAYWNKRCKFQTRRSPSAGIGNLAASKRTDVQKG